jgi:hypothetical protein
VLAGYVTEAYLSARGGEKYGPEQRKRGEDGGFDIDSGIVNSDY